MTADVERADRRCIKMHRTWVTMMRAGTTGDRISAKKVQARCREFYGVVEEG